MIVADGVNLRGPGGVVVELRRSEVHPDDPGAGVPARVRLGDATASFAAALGEGELDAGRMGPVRLTQAQKNWLVKIETKVDEWLTADVKAADGGRR